MQLSHARTRSHFACSTDGTPWSHLSPLPAEEVFSAQFLAQFFAHKVVEAMLWRKGMQATLLCAITLLSGAFRRPDPGRQCTTCLLAPMRLHWTAARMHTSPSVGRSHMNALLTHIPTCTHGDEVECSSGARHVPQGVPGRRFSGDVHQALRGGQGEGAGAAGVGSGEGLEESGAAGAWRRGRRSSAALEGLRQMRRDLEEQQGLRAQARDLKSKAHDKLLVLRAALCSSVPREEGASSRSAEGRTDDGVGAGMVDIGDVLGSTWQDPDVISKELIALTEAHEAAGTERGLFMLRHVRHIRLDGWGEGANAEWTVIEAENPWGVERQAAPDGGGDAGRGGTKHKHTTHTHTHKPPHPPHPPVPY